MLLLCCSLLLAQEIPLSIDEESTEESAEDNLQILWEKLSDEEHLDIVYELQRSARYDDALQRLQFMESRADSPLIQYEMARNLEFMNEDEESLFIYEQLIGLDLDDWLMLNICFRRALLLSDADHHKEAISTLKHLSKRFSLTESEMVAVQLALGTSELQAGKRRKGIKRIERSIQSLETPRQHAWLQARARYALAQELLDEARTIVLKSSNDPTKLKAQVRRRLEKIQAAEQQIAVVLQLESPEYALRGFIDCADARLLLYDDVIAVPPPPSFTPEQAHLYRSTMKAEAIQMQQKAFDYYTKALRYAEQLNWPGDLQKELIDKREIVAREKQL